MYTSLPVILDMSDKKTPDLYRGRSGEPYRLCCTSMHVCAGYAPIYITALHCASPFCAPALSRPTSRSVQSAADFDMLQRSLKERWGAPRCQTLQWKLLASLPGGVRR